ncbi:MAG: hypothetical protein IJ702_07845 [Fretibacterium sp.]|nr:hypothetical protein [Fretibacterium sp.]
MPSPNAKIPSIAQMQSTVDRMQDIRSTVLFPRWKAVPAVQQAIARLKEQIGKRARLLATGKADDRVQAKKVWALMSNSYWDILFALLDAQTAPHMGALPASLAFDKTERLFIDFGIIADATLPFHRDFDAVVALQSQCEGGVFPCMAFSDFIAECWSMIMGTPAPVPTIGPAASDRPRILQGQLEKAQFHRDALLQEIWDEFVINTALNLPKLIEDLNGCLLPAMKVITRVPEFREAEESVRRKFRQDRLVYQEAEDAVLLMISSAQKDGVLPPQHAARFTELHERTKVLAKKLLYAQNDAKKIARRAKKITDACAELSPQMKRNELRSMLTKKKEYLTVPSKNARCDDSPFCPTDALPIDYQTAASELEAMSAMDMDMFNVPRVRMYGIPRAVFVPGQGLGTYDWSDNSLLIPLFPVGGEDKSLSYALATFRWDSDEDRHLKNPYEQIKENRKKSLLVMAASFYKDYFQWMTKESKGYRVLSRETSKVFQQMMAPRPDEE